MNLNGWQQRLLRESDSVLKPQTIDRHRAVVSIMEELEPVDWFDQRIDAATDEQLKEALAQHRRWRPGLSRESAVCCR